MVRDRAELAPEFVPEILRLLWLADAPAQVSRAEEGVGLCRLVTNPDDHVEVERADRLGAFVSRA
jgi:hypothetical protein